MKLKGTGPYLLSMLISSSMQITWASASSIKAKSNFRRVPLFTTIFSSSLYAFHALPIFYWWDPKGISQSNIGNVRHCCLIMRAKLKVKNITTYHSKHISSIFYRKVTSPFHFHTTNFWAILGSACVWSSEWCFDCASFSHWRCLKINLEVLWLVGVRYCTT